MEWQILKLGERQNKLTKGNKQVEKFEVKDTRQYQKDALYEAICQVKEMLETDRSMSDIKQYLKSITNKDHGQSEIYALVYAYEFMEQIK